ncbi:DUF305 domain-containing protein [Caulobacter sp. Root487D2Y]|uniref:DUF305 domain-containing protein n=1 Tax=Caulobacter sp. Root487D2Y TaxID=1736547 RepID=UPI0009E6FE1A|nr:DUF305 domain-containing protein [Caulobacter sp. Root487D2Y]
MSPVARPSKRIWAPVLIAASLGCAAPLAASTPADGFKAENDAAMSKMMSAMDVKPTGDVDRDFVEMMIPHHQGGIDMAVAELRYGKNEQLRRVAQEIIVEQQQEIAAMRLALGDPLPPAYAAPTAPAPAALPSAPPTPRHHAAPAKDH